MRFILTFLIIIPIATISAQHSIPKDVQKEVEAALRFYPELEDTQIEFRFKKNIKKSTMQARPTFWSLFKSRKNRNLLIQQINATLNPISLIREKKGYKPVPLFRKPSANNADLVYASH